VISTKEAAASTVKMVIFGGNTSREVDDAVVEATQTRCPTTPPTGTGGGGGNTSSRDVKSNEVLQFKLDRHNPENNASAEWEVVQTFGNRPEARSFHTASAFGAFLFIHGGRGLAGELNDLFILDTSTYHWHRPAVFGHEHVSTRAWHTATVLPQSKKICIFGGGNEKGPLDTVVMLEVHGFI
jgi:hypothetical protein